MKMKRICAFCALFTFLLGFLAFAENDEQIKFGEVSVNTGANETTVTVPILTKPAGKGVTLVAVYIHPDTGKILSINATPCADVSHLEKNEISVGVENKEADGAKLNYYVWDSLSGAITLLNNSPAAPLNIEGSTTVSRSHLTWDAPDDDYDAPESLKYNIYQDGMLIGEDIPQKEYNVKNLAWGCNYDISVRAVDSEGLLSDENIISVETPYKNTAHTTNEATSSPDGNLEFTGSETATERLYRFEKDNAGGLDCYKTTFRGSNATYLSYKFADDYFAEINGVKKFACELTYFDEGTDKITMHRWCLRNGSAYLAYDTPIVTKTNTMTWKTVRTTFTLGSNDVFAKNPDEGSAHFNFAVRTPSAGAVIKVRSFSVFPIYEDGRDDEYNNTIKKNAGAYFKADGAIISCDMNSNAEGENVERVALRDGVKLSSIGGELNFSVENAALRNGNVKIYVMYYAEDEDAIISLSGNSKKITASKKWQMMCFDAADLGSGINQITANNDIYINSVRVVSSN